MPREPLTWIHISDRHIHQVSQPDARRLDDSLVLDIARVLSGASLVPNMLFFTGDLVHGRHIQHPNHSVEQQFVDGALFLDRIRKALPQNEIPKSHVYIVPGNHDVNRDKVSKFEQESLFSKHRTQDEIDDLYDKLDYTHDQFMRRLDDYKSFLEKNRYDHCLTDPRRLIHASIRETDSLRIGIVGLNSAWPCGDDVRRNGKDGMRISARKQLDRLLPIVENCDCRIALVHHPHAWYSEDERADMWNHLLEARFHFCLHGHEHQQWVNSKRNHHTFAAGASYDRSDKPAGYSIVSLDFEQRQIRHWSRAYSREHGGGWIPRIVPGLHYEGEYTKLPFPEDLRPSTTKGSVTTPLIDLKQRPRARSDGNVPRFKLVAFDMDGTLVDMRGTEYSWAIFWRALKFPKALRIHGFQLHDRRIINYQQWCDYCADAFKLRKATREQLVQIVRNNCKLRPGAIRLLQRLKEANVRLAILSGGVNIVFETLFADPHDKLFDDVFVNRMLFDQDNMLSKIEASPYDFAGKLEGVQALCEKYKINPHDVMFVGDAPNDRHVAGYVGKLVGVTSAGQYKLNGHANVKYKGRSLDGLVAHVLGKDTRRRTTSKLAGGTERKLFSDA